MATRGLRVGAAKILRDGLNSGPDTPRRYGQMFGHECETERNGIKEYSRTHVSPSAHGGEEIALEEICRTMRGRASAGRRVHDPACPQLRTN